MRIGLPVAAVVLLSGFMGSCHTANSAATDAAAATSTDAAADAAAADSGGQACDEIAEHLYTICRNKPYSERARSDCQIYGMDRATRACLLRATECSSSSIDLPCNYS